MWLRAKNPSGVSATIVMIVLITAGHYLMDPHDVAFHNVFRRLYYVPVVLAAFARGLKGGVLAALAASLAYIPHAFFMEHHHDPAPAIDKIFEIVLYIVVGAMTGWLVERDRHAREELEHALQERKVMESQLVRAGKLSALGQLLAGVAHEVRNPLAAILGAAEGLERQLEGNPRGQRLVELQLREVTRLERVVSNFLALARSQPPQCTTFSLKDRLEELLELTRHQEPPGTFTLDESVEGAHMYADEDQVGQVLLNLTLNAIQSRGDAPFHVTYVYQQREVAGRLHDCVGVQDEGVGIPSEHIESVFEPFYTTRSTGSGLGLSLSSRMAEAHHGFLEVDSQPGATTFWLCLPHSGETP